MHPPPPACAEFTCTFCGPPPRPPNYSLRSPSTTQLAPSTKAGFRKPGQPISFLEPQARTSSAVRRFSAPPKHMAKIPKPCTADTVRWKEKGNITCTCGVGVLNWHTHAPSRTAAATFNTSSYPEHRLPSLLLPCGLIAQENFYLSRCPGFFTCFRRPPWPFSTFSQAQPGRQRHGWAKLVTVPLGATKPGHQNMCAPTFIFPWESPGGGGSPHQF